MTFMPRSVLEASAADETPALRVSTKYMQTFQLVKPALGGTSLTTCCNTSGNLDIYSTGTGDQIYRMRRGEDADAPYSEIDLGFAANQIFTYVEAGISSDTPNILGVGASGELMLSVYQTGTDSYSQTVCQPPSATQKLRRFLGVRGPGGGVYANVILDDGVLANNFMKPGTTTWAGAEWVPILGPDGEELKPKTLAMCENDPVQSAMFAIGENYEVLFAEDSFRGTKMRVLTSSATLNAADHLSVAADADGKLNIFAVEIGDGALWWKKERKYSTDGVIQFDDWVRIATETGTGLTRVFACQRFDGLLQVFGIGTDGRLQRATQVDAGNGNIVWRSLFPLGNSVTNAAFTVGRTAQGYAEAYTVSPSGSVRRFWQAPGTLQWFDESIQLPELDSTMAEVPTHACEITVLDKAGIPLPFARVSIGASNLVTLFVDGKSYRCSQVDNVSVQTGIDGKVVIHQRANALAAATLYIELPGTLAGVPLSVQPNIELQERLSALTSNDILNAKDASGAYLLSDKYRKPEYAESLQKITEASMNIAAQDEGGGKVTYKFISHRSSALGFSPCTDLSSLNDTAWEIDFSSGFPLYRDTTTQAVEEWKAGKLTAMAETADAEGVLGIDWGDLWNGIKEGAEWIFGELKKIVVTIVDGIGTILFDLGGKIFEAIISFAQQAFDFVEGVWNWLKVKLEQLFEWLAFLFNFEDFVRTAQVVRCSVRTVLDFSIAGVGYVKDVIVEGIDSLKEQLEEVVDRYVAELNGQNNPTINAFARENEPTEEQSWAGDHNLFLNAYRENHDGATPVEGGGSMFLVNEELSSSLDSVIDQLSEMANNFQFGEGKEAFEEAVGYFSNIGSEPDRVLELLMSGVVKTLEATALFALDFARGVIITLMDLMADLITVFRDAIFAEWEIPVVSDLYKLFTGKTLSIQVVDIMAYLVAIPGTLIFKVITGRAPYPDEASVKEFEDFFTVAWLESKMGMTANDNLVMPEVPNKDVKIVFLSLYSAAMLVRMFTDGVTAFNSAKAGVVPVPDGGDGGVPDGVELAAMPSPPVMAGVAITLRYFTTISTCPWLLDTSLGAPECGAGNRGFVAYPWICQVVFGPTRGVLIAVLMRTSDAKARAYTGEITLTVWGAVHIIMGVWHYCWSPSDRQDPLALSRALTNWIPGQFLRFLATPDMNQTAYPLVPYVIFLVVQTLSYGGSIGCAIAEAVKANENLNDQEERLIGHAG